MIETLRYTLPPLSALTIFFAAGCGPVDPADTPTDTTGDVSNGASTGAGHGGSGGSGGAPSTSSGEGAAGSTGGSGGAPSPEAPRVIGYYAAWDIYARQYYVADTPASQLTHINYAFANIADGECVLGDPWADVDKPMGDDDWNTPLRGNFHQLQILKAAHPGLQTLISVGGWTWSSGFSAVASTEASRAKFAASCVKFMKDYDFDGIDVDWEYPVGGGLQPGVPADKHNYTLLLQELRAELDAQGVADSAHYLLSIAAPAGPSTIEHLEVDQIHPYLDHINVMAYDFHGAWESTTNFNAPLHPSAGDPAPPGFNVAAAADAYLAKGAPAGKIVIGMAFYGHGWQGVGGNNQGLFQPASGPAPSMYEAGTFEYRELAALMPSYTRYWDDQAKVPWLHSPTSAVMISYDDAESLGLKATYVKDKGLGGAMIWQLAGDDARHTLIGAIHGALGL